MNNTITKATVDLTPVTQERVCDLIPLMASLYEHEDLPFDPAHTERNVRRLLLSPHHGTVFFLKQADTVVGYCVLVSFFSLEHGGMSILLDELLIKNEFRGMGLGTAALETIHSYCQMHNIRALQLEVSTDNPAQELYRRCGFSVQGRLLMVRSVA
jgi:ribosomal protein S18 acetylase RimI-like enzyme